MSYNVLVTRTVKGSKAMDSPMQTEVNTIEAARDHCTEIIDDRMEAFSEDREALHEYGFYNALDWAESLGEDGGTITLADGWRIEVTPCN